MVKLDPDEVYEVGHATVKFAGELESSGPLKKVAVNDVSFGELDEARDFVFVHGAAQQQVEETLTWVSQTLNDFGVGLKKSVEGLRAAEDQAQASIQGVVDVLGLPINIPDPSTSVDENALTNISEIPGVGPNGAPTNQGADA